MSLQTGSRSDRLASWGVGIALVLLVCWSLEPSWHTGLSGEDFPGHVALLQRFLARLGDPDWLPLWTSDWSCGTSLVLAYLHPIGALLVLSPFTSLFGPELGLRVGDTFFVVLAALAMWVWCRSLGVSRLAGFLGALFYALHPMLFVYLGRSGQVHQPVTMAVVPLIFWAFRRMALSRDVGRWLLAVFATAALALDMQRFWLLLPFLLIAYLAMARQPDQPLRALYSPLAWAATAGLGSALLLCFPVLPALLERPELMGHPEDLLEGYRQSFPLPHLLALLDRDAWLSEAVEGVHAARSGIHAGSAYQGIAGVLFVGLGAALAFRRSQSSNDSTLRARLALLSAGAAACLALSMGLRPLLAQHARILTQLFETQRGVVPWLAVLLVIAAAGLALLLCMRAAAERWPAAPRFAGAASLSGALLLGTVTPFLLIVKLPIYSEVRGPAHFAFPLLPFLLGTAASLVFASVHRALGPRIPALALAAGLALVHAVDLLPYREMLRPTRTAVEEEDMRNAFRQLAEAPPGRLLTSRDYAPLAEMLGVMEAQKPAAWNWLSWSTRATTGDWFRLGVFGPLEAARRGLPGGLTEFAARTAGLANVRYIARAYDDDGAIPGDPAFKALVDTGDVQIVENLRALPFAQFYPRLALVSGGLQKTGTATVQLAFVGVATYAIAAADEMPTELRFDYVEGARARALAAYAPPIPRALSAPNARPPVTSPCHDPRRREPELVLHCEFEEPGYLVVAESWAPGWRAQVDGQPRALYRLNLAFQGLRVSPGDREIRLRYIPSRLQRASLVVSVCAWLGLAGWGLQRWRRLRSAPHDRGELR